MEWLCAESGLLRGCEGASALADSGTDSGTASLLVDVLVELVAEVADGVVEDARC